MMTLKEVKQAIKNKGLNFDEWKKEVIDRKLLALISKDKEVYPKWELSVLNEEVIQLLIKDSTPYKSNKSILNHNQKNEIRKNNSETNK